MVPETLLKQRGKNLMIFFKLSKSCHSECMSYVQLFRMDVPTGDMLFCSPEYSLIKCRQVFPNKNQYYVFHYL